MIPFKAVVFDWAGTMIDFGSFAPMGVFVKAFEAFRIDATIDEAREPMGTPKRDHIAAMMRLPSIADQWRDRYGEEPGDVEIDKVYEVFVPMNEAVVADYATLVPGAKETADWLRARDIKIGSTTGYTRSIMEHVLPIAAEQGYEPDNLVCSDEVPEGRPGPLAMYRCFLDLVVHPPEAVIKVDDTEPGIAEGVAAGCLTIGVALSGNYVGRTPEELAGMDGESVDKLRQAATVRLKSAGADHVIDTVAELPDLMRSLQPSLEF